MSDFRLNLIQGIKTARKLENLDIVVNNNKISGSIYFNLTGYDMERSITAMYSNPNNYINTISPTIPPEIASNPRAIIGVTDMELSNIVRNQDWFDHTHFFIIENNELKILSKPELESKFGIKCIKNLIGQ